MLNPYNIFIKYNQKEGHERPTITRTAKRIGVSPNTLYAWLTGKKRPRRVNLLVLANHLKISENDAMALIERSSAIAKAGHKLPFGIMVTWDMLTNSYARLLNGQDPFPKDLQKSHTGRIEYD